MEHWPPVYDSDDLAKQIREIIERDHLAKEFFDSRSPIARVCQGDIVSFPSELPLIDSEGQASITDEVFNLWFVIGNSCDFERDLTDVEWSQIVPLVTVGDDNSIDYPTMAELKRYRYARQFYVPDWTSAQPARHYLADFTRPVTAHKETLLRSALQARLSQPAWVLLHACLIRFLCRDDRRFVA